MRRKAEKRKKAANVVCRRHIIIITFGNACAARPLWIHIINNDRNAPDERISFSTDIKGAYRSNAKAFEYHAADKASGRRLPAAYRSPKANIIIAAFAKQKSRNRSVISPFYKYFHPFSPTERSYNIRLSRA